MPFKKTGISLAFSLLLLTPFATLLSAKDSSSHPQFTFKTDPVTQHVRMLKGKSGAITFTRQTGESNADAIKRQFAPYFGIRNPDSELVVKSEFSSSPNRQNIRYQQLHNGIPVIGGELVANLKAQQLTSLSGETSQVNIDSLVTRVNAEQAQATAIAAVSKWYTYPSAQLTTSKPQLEIYDPKLIGPGTGPQHLVWQLNVTPNQIAPINEYILIDAQTNAIVLHFNTVHTARNRETYTANGTPFLPGTLVCNESQTNCTNNADPDADAAHFYAGDTYDFYSQQHGRDGIDGTGATIISTVHWNDGLNCPNAFWDGSQMVYCDTFSQADDVVSHELTHGVTNSTSNLFYYYQSGAINESLSDVWGEFVDLTNGSGNDSSNVRWLLGEDLPGIGAVRDMANPTSFGDPDRMTSPNYYTGSLDFGGVHSNSGVNNKAVSLIVDGGNFNGQVITGIGISKTAAIYYDVQTNYLISGSDYLDLYNALNQSCQDLLGFNGITGADCTQVNNALLAVEMNQQPITDFNPDAEICPAGSIIATTLFYDDFENNFANWNSTNLVGNNPWAILIDYATSGSRAAFAPGIDSSTDSVLTQSVAVSIPATGTYYLHFNHIFSFESALTSRYDGGVIEYSVDNGANWTDAGSIIDNGRNYNGTLSDATNPLFNRDAFTSTSHGYNSTRLNLTSLAEQSVRFRFRNATDGTISSLGWAIDDVRIYSCMTNSPPTSNAGIDQDVNANVNVTLSGSGNDPDTDAISYLWRQTSGTIVTLNGATTTTPSFTSPASGGALVFQLRVTDAFGQYANDIVTVNVNGLPIANAGSDQTVNLDAGVTLNGSNSTDPEGNALTYSWVQTGGTSVNLSSANVASPTFTAPSAATTLMFQLTVTDDHNQTDVDSVTITVQEPAPPSGGSGCTVSPNGRFDPIWLLLLVLFATLHIVHKRKMKNQS